MPHQASLPSIGDPFIELPSVDSTNNYAMAQAKNGMAYHGTAYFANQQTAGKGQRGKIWTANPGENVILSIVLQPLHLKPGNSFLLSAAVANACYEFFKNYAGPDTCIKWPNDIYWRDRKAGGILIENIIRNHQWSYSVVGIGLNINQTSFANLPNPVSLKQITGVSYHPIELAKELCHYLETSYQKLSVEPQKIIDHYNENLYKKYQLVKLRKKNIVFEATVQGVTAAGKLITQNKMTLEFDFGEVEWLV